MEYLRTVQANDDDTRRWLRALGGLLLGVGVLVLAYRRSSLGDPWGDFALFLVALLPALFLYGGGLLAALNSEDRSAWHGVFLVFGLIFALFTFFQFLELIDGDTGAALNVAWIFGAVAALGVAAALLADVRFAMLAAGIAFIVAWFAVWDAILGEDFSTDAGTIRGFSMLAAGVLLVAAVGLHWHRRGRHLDPPFDDEYGALPAELLTASGLVFLFGAGILSATAAIVQSFLGLFAPLGEVGGGFAGPSLFWDIVLLVGSLALVVFGVFFRVRGPAYVGAIGLTIFIVIVGLDLDDSSPSGSVLGWPLVLLLLAAAALVASVLLPRRDEGSGQVASQPEEGRAPPQARPARTIRPLESAVSAVAESARRRDVATRPSPSPNDWSGSPSGPKRAKAKSDGAPVLPATASTSSRSGTFSRPRSSILLTSRPPSPKLGSRSPGAAAAMAGQSHAARAVSARSRRILAPLWSFGGSLATHPGVRPRIPSAERDSSESANEPISSSTCKFFGGSSLFDSRSHCEPTHSAWELISDVAHAFHPVGTHLFSQVLRPSGTGKLEPLFSGGRF